MYRKLKENETVAKFIERSKDDSDFSLHSGNHWPNLPTTPGTGNSYVVVTPSYSMLFIDLILEVAVYLYKSNHK